MTTFTYTSQCPHCEGQGTLYRDEVDVGVGIMSGPFGCTECGWSEDPEYDLNQPGGRDPDERGGYKDQYGGYHPAGSTMALAYRLARDGESSGGTPSG